MYKPKDEKEKTIHRMKIAHGHLEKVLRMFESNEYCIDILHQSQAVQKALKEIDGIILENHLRTCAADAIKNGNQTEAIEEIMSIFKKKNS